MSWDRELSCAHHLGMVQWGSMDAGGEAITGLWETGAGCSRARGESRTPVDPKTRTWRRGWGLGVGIHCGNES